ncbi:hypothetical protein TCDM_08485 [Trypanosoma cruzi Dm28c]|uniref:Uncharacterized protein n=1 Tax=Trypanosoma cruzi Dm28c TaxID=1416333 RepID=V5D881_TRYCR|nr:hypothetical protein TCDM_08485 [Trypanosoma cruzi Dm28c]PBJ80656.1 hypothetical protein BCY84_00851 [Trypanosoma cruzi cruzi]
MPYKSSTESSRRRARTPVAALAAADHPCGSQTPADAETTRRAKSDVPSRLRIRSRVERGLHQEAKKARMEPRTAQSQHEEELRLSRELTLHCNAVVQRVHALADKTQIQEERLSQTLKESIERSPIRQSSVSPKREAIGSLSPQPTSTRKTPRESLSRWSGMFGTPQVPKAPPPTPAHPDPAAGASSSVGWLAKVLGRSPEAKPIPNSKGTTPSLKCSNSPPSADVICGNPKNGAASTSPSHAAPEEHSSLLMRAVQRLSGRFSSPPKEAGTPNCARKSVVFKETAELGAKTPQRPTKRAEGPQESDGLAPRGSLLYPPAPPPSLQKDAERRSPNRSPSSSDGEQQSAVGPDGSEVVAVMQNFSHSRAFHKLTKADLVAYAKLHHVALAMSSTKKELFEVVRRLVQAKTDETQ